MYTMPYLLAPSPSPPPSSRFLSSESSPASSASSKLGGSSSCTPSTAPTSPLPPRKTQGGRSGTIIDAEEDPDILPKMPTLSLDVNAISDVMAARLTTCLIGHVLYLKSQVPFPVAQLSKMSSRMSRESKWSKKRETLLASFDLLSSHLGTTFTALSTALARTRQFRRQRIRSLMSDQAHATKKKTGATVHIVLVLGPSISNASAAKGRVVLALQGLNPRVWGERVDSVRETFTIPNISGSDEEPGLDEREYENEDDGEGAYVSDVESVPESECSSDTRSDDDSEFSSERDSDVDEVQSVSELEEIEVDLLAAERQFSRILAIANADPELGMAAELCPMQMHILIQAPRRFSHPAWIPRQNLSRDMNQVLRGFDDPPGSDDSRNGNRKVQLRTDYVRVQCKDSVNSINVVVNDSENEGEDEEDELIWWSWDGKLEGFSDW